MAIDKCRSHGDIQLSLKVDQCLHIEAQRSLIWFNLVHMCSRLLGHCVKPRLPGLGHSPFPSLLPYDNKHESTRGKTCCYGLEHWVYSNNNNIYI